MVHRPISERPFSERPISERPIFERPISERTIPEFPKMRPISECDQSPNDQSPNATNLRMRPILVNITNFLMFILPPCFTSVDLVGNEKFRGFS
jgi:hypothetical protein